MTAAAAFLGTGDRADPRPGRRAARALSAAEAKIQAGALDAAEDLLAAAEAGPLGDLERARADLARAQLAFITSRGAEAAPLLVNAARRLADVDPGLSRATYLDALSAAIFAGRLAGPGGGVLAVARAAASAPPPEASEVPGVAGASRERRRRRPLPEGRRIAGTSNEGPDDGGGAVLRRSLTAFGDGAAGRTRRCAGCGWRWWPPLRTLGSRLHGRAVRPARATGSRDRGAERASARADVSRLLSPVRRRPGPGGGLAEEFGAVREATGIALAPYAARRGGRAPATRPRSRP